MPGSVLIIDAEEGFANQLADAVRSHGLEPNVTGDGKVGLDLARINIPSAIVLCVELPRMSGYSICAKLKKDPALKAVPLVISSSEATPDTFDSHKKLKTRAEEYLKKPFSPELLLEVLRSHGVITGDAAPRVEDEVAIDEELQIEDQPPVTLSDDEAFSNEDLSMESDAQPQTDDVESIDDALEALSDPTSPPQPMVRQALGQPAALREREPSAHVPSEVLDEPGFEEDEIMTSVGQRPSSPSSGSEGQGREIANLKAKLEKARAEKISVERERDVAIANEKAAQVQIQTAAGQNPSSVPSGAPSSGREALQLKQELTNKSRQILELKDQLHSQEKEMLARQEHEMELESRVVQADEERVAADAARVAAEARIAGAEAKATEIQRSTDQTIRELNGRIGEAAAHEAELDGALQSVTEQAELLRDRLEKQDAALASTTEELQTTKRQREAYKDDLTRLTNELSATVAEAESLRLGLSSAQSTVEDLAQRVSEFESRVVDIEGERDGLKNNLRDLAAEREASEGRVSRAYQKIREDEKIRGKARKAMEIALALLQETTYASNAEEPSSSLDEGESVDEARS